MNGITESEITEIKTWLQNGSINIFGLPYSGKDTHGKWLAEIFEANLLGGGDILRNSIIPKHVEEAMAKGLLAPTQDYVDIVVPYLSREEFANKPLVLSSVGRWHGEEDGVMEAAEKSGHPIKAVIYLDISPTVAHKRYQASIAKGDRQKRHDDGEDILAIRFHEFNSKTLPVIAYYEDKNLLIDIDGNPPVEEVRNVILKSLLERARTS